MQREVDIAAGATTVQIIADTISVIYDFLLTDKKKLLAQARRWWRSFRDTRGMETGPAVEHRGVSCFAPGGLLRLTALVTSMGKQKLYF